jgi:ubiquitin-conjugating enzyme E2 D/E
MYLHANTTTIRRALGLKLKTELSKIQKNLPLGCISCTAPNTITTWKAWIHGPPETPYAGGKFLVLLTFLESFPYNPPRVSWKTKIFHPQIEQDGKVCHELLHWDWNPSFNVSSILLALFFLLVTPSSEESVVRPVGRMLKEQPEQFMKVCREWTEKYAQEGPEVEEGFWERGDKEDDPEDNGS